MIFKHDFLKELKVVNITEVMIKLQFKLPQALISRGFTQRVSTLIFFTDTVRK